MIRRPPRSTLFPTRRSSDLQRGEQVGARRVGPVEIVQKNHQQRAGRQRPEGVPHLAQQALTARSEEHTSELQSRLHLVCRLLLEKKKNIHNSIYYHSSRHAT